MSSWTIARIAASLQATPADDNDTQRDERDPTEPRERTLDLVRPHLSSAFVELIDSRGMSPAVP